MPEIEYVWDELSDNVIEEYEDGVLTMSYTHEPGLYGNLLSHHRNGVISYYHYDGRGDTVALTDDTGSVTDTKEYDAWGNVFASTGSTVTSFLFGGRQGYQTGNTGVYVRARMYQPTMARWSSVDSIRSIVDSANGYAPDKVTPSGLSRASSQPAGCMIALRCGNVSSGQVHCGLVVTNHPDYPGRTIGIDGSGGDVNEIQIEDPVTPYGTTGTASPFSDKVCKCLTSYRIKWNARKVPRNHICNNSNFTLKCMNKACGIMIPWTTGYPAPIGYFCRQCVKWAASTGPGDCDLCVETAEVGCNEYIISKGGSPILGLPPEW